MGFEYPFRFAPILPRNTPLPASRSEMFHTVSDNQPEVQIEVYQGESEDCRRNFQVGNFRIQGLAKVPAGNPLIVQCDLTLDGILKVVAREKATGLVKQITIENPFARYEAEERGVARERLERLWGDAEPIETAGEPFVDEPDAMPEIVHGPREGQRETVQARALLEKAERLKETVPAEDRAEVDRLMQNVRAAVTDRQWDKVTAGCNELSDILFYLEDA